MIEFFLKLIGGLLLGWRRLADWSNWDLLVEMLKIGNLFVKFFDFF